MMKKRSQLFLFNTLFLIVFWYEWNIPILSADEMRQNIQIEGQGYIGGLEECQKFPENDDDFKFSPAPKTDDTTDVRGYFIRIFGSSVIMLYCRCKSKEQYQKRAF